jgi:hypothetical protein
MNPVRGSVRRSGRRARRSSVLGLIGATLGVLLGTTPGMAADNGAVDAEVTIEAAAACIELSTSSISFGTLGLGAENAAGTPGITVTNCGDANATILASGTNASGTGAAWNLVDSAATCADTLGTDNYHLGLATPLGASIATLSTSNKEVGTLAGAATVDHVARISTACPGSSGAGQTMSLQVNYIATNEVTPPIVLEEIPATQQNADLAAAYLAPATRDYDTPANCAGNPSIACPGGVPSNPLPQVHIEASNVSTVQVAGTPRWTMSSVLDVSTPTGIPVTYSGTSCTANVDSGLGASPTFQGSADLNFLSYPDPAGATNYISVANANITGVETDDVTLTGGFSCTLLGAFASVFVPMLEDQIEAYLEGNICGAPEPAVFVQCPALP